MFHLLLPCRHPVGAHNAMHLTVILCRVTTGSVSALQVTDAGDPMLGGATRTPTGALIHLHGWTGGPRVGVLGGAAARDAPVRAISAHGHPATGFRAVPARSRLLYAVCGKLKGNVEALQLEMPCLDVVQEVAAQLAVMRALRRPELAALGGVHQHAKRVLWPHVLGLPLQAAGGRAAVVMCMHAGRLPPASTVSPAMWGARFRVLA